MVKKKTNNKARVNNSISSLPTFRLEGLKKVMLNMGGTVTYYFETERIIFTTDEPDGETVISTSILQSSINSQCFLGERGKKTPQQLLQMFQDIAWDLGATRFELN